MRFNVEVEKPSSILRKLTIRVPATEVKSHLDRGFVNVQKTANLKGFRPGQAPISIIKQYYGEDIRHRVFHSLIDESIDQAVRQNEFKTIGSPKIDTSTHQTGTGDHDHSIHEDQDLVFTATFEVIPEIQVKDYTGVALTQEKVSVTDEMVEKVVENLLGSQAQLVPVDGSTSSRPAQQGDFVDTKFSGGLVSGETVLPREDMKGNRLIEIGSQSMIAGFEEQLIGMRAGDSKTFRIHFPSDYGGNTQASDMKSLAGKEAEFSVSVQEIKEKKLPTLDDEFAKQMGYESLVDLREKAKDFLFREQTDESQGKVQSELVAYLIEKTPFEVPSVLIDSQMKALVQDWSQEMKKQGYPDQVIQDTIQGEAGQLKGRAESQVRASLILECIAKEEKISVTASDIKDEISRLAISMKLEDAKLESFYAKNPGRKGDLEFRLRQERTLKFLLDKANIKSIDAKVK